MFTKDYPIGQEDPLIAYKMSADPDTLYMHELMKALDWKKFISAMQK